MKKIAVVLNGFIHDFAAGYWLAAVFAIVFLHRSHLVSPGATPIVNPLERIFFWQSVAAMLLIFATGAGRTFTYVENWYGPDAERARRKALIVKHIILFARSGRGTSSYGGRPFTDGEVAPGASASDPARERRKGRTR